ncbi:hypothetical protein UFOVP124_26 [uncultured Caudovirales phage]|uniref:Uncharacterized protein n=1 Tax=uncultured Caudovirales phage TaxID=2100421 RepID=A0A6J5LGD2_9CAUD|nr:hypothetical protein UFOVP124_26 [uncultured Caudovirales phage]
MGRRHHRLLRRLIQPPQGPRMAPHFSGAFRVHYPGHLAYLEEAATQLGITDRSIVDQARRLGPLSNMSSLVGQAYEAKRVPIHADVDLAVAQKQADVLEVALTAARAILMKARADLSDKIQAAQVTTVVTSDTEPPRPRRR